MMRLLRKSYLLLLALLPQYAIAASYDTFFGGSCPDYNCWIEKVWKWALAAALPLSVVVLIFAGIVYMTSGGNPDRVGMAKKMIIGVISGVSLLILARIFLVTFIGVPWPKL